MALDNFRTIELIWDKANKSIIKTIKTASSDTTGRYLSVKILDGGQEVTLNNAKLQLYWEHPNFNTSGTDDFNTVNNGGLFNMTFSDEMLTNIGELNAHLVLTLADGTITSGGFPIEVFKGADNGVVVPTNGKGLVEQVARKIDKGNVTLNDLTQEVKLALTGGAVAIVGENAVGTENIKDSSVTAEKLEDRSVTTSKVSFINRIQEASPNKFYPDEITTGGYIGADGNWVVNALYAESNMIDVVTGKVYQHNGYNNLAKCYDSEGNFITSSQNNPLTIHNSDIKKVTIHTPMTAINTTMFMESEFWTGQYIKPRKEQIMIPSQVINSEQLVEPLPTEKLADKSVTTSKVSFIETQREETVNRFHPDEITPGGYVNNSGVWVDNATYVESNMIDVEQGKSYKHNGYLNTTKCYDSEGNFITTSTQMPLVVFNSNIKKVSIHTPLSAINTTMFAESEFWTGQYIEPYKEKIMIPNQVISTEQIEGYKELSTVPKSVITEINNVEDAWGFNEPYHPSVVYIPGGFAGYKYWEVNTPYPLNNAKEHYIDRYEVPHIHASNDGYNWDVKANPLDDVTSEEIELGTFMSDPHIVYRQDINQLEAWYRISHEGKNVATGTYNKDKPIELVRKTTTDGINWSTRQVVIRTEGSDLQTSKKVISPSIIWDNNKKVYRIWYRSEVAPWLFYREWDSVTNTFSAITSVQLDKAVSANILWHIDVNFYKNAYHLVSYNTSDETMHYWRGEESTNGLVFEYVKEILNTVDTDFDRLYRGVSLIDEQGKIRFYVCGTIGNKRQMALILTDESLSRIILVDDMLDGSNILLSNGRTLEQHLDDILEKLNI